MTPNNLKWDKKGYQKYSYGSEQGCDVAFLVGPEDDKENQWRLPAHKEVLQSSNMVFRAMLSHNFACERIVVPDVDGRAFDNLLRFLYSEEVDLKTWQSALETLYAAHKYQCPNLVQQCVDFLSPKIDHSNVLSTIKLVQYLGCDFQNLENISRENKLAEKGPTNGKLMKKWSMNNENEENDNLNSIETKCAILLQICLCYVDKEAPTILRSDEMEDLDLATIRLILSRDTLYVPDELMVFTALYKWADKNCKKKQLPLTAVSKREVLGELLFLPRYVTMSRLSFEKGPLQSGLFTPEESTSLLKIISGARYEISSPNSSTANSPVHQVNNPYNANHIVQPPATLRPFIKTMSTPRNPIRASMPNSSPKKKGFRLLEKLKRRKSCCCRKTSSQNSTPANSNQSSPVRRGNQSQQVSSPRSNTVVENIFICLACIFD